MTALRHFALGCCILCALAGVITVFWPDNSFKPVINTVLILYTVTSAVQLSRSVDWAQIHRSVLALNVRAQTLPEQSLNEYAQELSLQASAQALGEILRKSSIPCEVYLEGDTCVIILQDEENFSDASTLLRLNAGSMPWRIETGDNSP